MKISKQELEQIIAEAISESSEIDEGLWDKVKAFANSDVNWENAKYLASKAGTLADKMPGGDKKKAAAAEKMQAIIDKEGNTYIKDMDAVLKQKFENFPNGRSHEEFVEGAAVIFAVYETIAKRAKEDKEFCPIAEPIVADLLNYVRYLMDHKLADAYKHFKENQEQDGEILSEEEGGTFGGRAGSSKTMKGLKSNMAPAILALGGATAALGSVLLQQPWFIELITGGGASAGSKAKQVLDVAPGEGPTQMLGRIIHGNAGHYGPKVPLGNMLSDMAGAGINPADLSKLGANPSTFLSTWNSLVGAPGAASQSMAQVFGAAPKGGLLWHPTLKAAGSKIGKTIVGGAGAAAAQTAGFAAIAQGLLGPLAVGLAASAGAVMAIRKKGLHSSRAQVFQDILDQMEEIKCEDGPGPEDPEDPCKDKPGTKWNPETKECEEDTGGEDCEDKPGTKWNPETEECECPDDLTWNPETKECEDIKPPPEQPPASPKRLGLLRLDDDGVKVYIGTRRSQDQRDYERDVMSKAQDNTITGRNTTPSTDNLNEPPGGFKMGRRIPNPEEVEWKDLQKAVKGRSKREPEPYVTVDASIYNDSAKALRKGGVKVRANSREFKAAIKSTVEQLLKKFLALKKKQTVRQARQTIKSRFRREKIEINPRAIRGLITVLQDYGLVRSGELPDEPTKAPAGEEEIVDDGGRRPNPINESLTLDRWKALSGIK